MTSDDQYDVVFSEPSNPYRAGIASLYSQDFYPSAVTKMTERGVFVQWVQTYEIDALTIKTAIATMERVFPTVEIWSTMFGSDILLVGFKSDQRYSLAEMETRAQQSPYREGLAVAWGVSGVGGVLSGFIAGAPTTRAIADSYRDFVDTDDRPILEFGLARTVDRTGFSVSRDELVEAAQQHGDGPPNTDASVPTAQISDAYSARLLFRRYRPMRPATSSDAGTPLAIRSRSRAAAADKKFGQALTLWDSQPAPLTHPGDLRWRAVATTDQALPEDPVVAAELGRVFPVELELTRAVRLRDERRGDGLAQQLVVAFEAAREHPLYDSESTRVAFQLAKSVGEGQPHLALQLMEPLEGPFLLHRLERHRVTLLLDLANSAKSNEWCLKALEQLEPHTPWRGGALSERVRCYEDAGAPRAGVAREEYEEFLSPQKLSFWP